MAQLDFYALQSDLVSVVNFIFDETDCRVFEAYSRPGHELREFSSLESLLESDCLEVNHGRFFLRILSRSVNCDPIFREFTLEETGQNRREVNAPAMFQIIEGHRIKFRDDALNWSTFSHWNEAGAKQRSGFSSDVLNAVDWTALRKLSGQINRHIKNRLAVASVHKRPVLPEAFRKMDETLTLWAGPGVVDKYSDLLVTK